MGGIIINCEPGSFAISGSDVELEGKRDYLLVCEAGRFSITGKKVNIARNRGKIPNLRQPIYNRHSSRNQ